MNNSEQPSTRVKVDYGKPECGTGNLTTSCPSIDRMQKVYRKLLMKDSGLFDIDMADIGIQIMTQVFESMHIDCTLTRRYLEPDIRKYVLRAIDRDRDAAKKEVQRIFNGGAIKKRFLLSPRT